LFTLAFSEDKYILSEVGVHKKEMRAIGDILRDSDQRMLHIICFASMPDWPMAASTGLLKMNILDAQMSCLPVIFLCFF